MTEPRDRPAAPGPPAGRPPGEPAVPPLPPGEPEPSMADPHALLRGYLDYYRDTLLRKLDGLPDDELRRSRLPSAWTPLQLVRHLTYVELRWLCWGFAAEQVPDPWGDHGSGDAWYVPEGATSEQIIADFRAQCARSREVVSGAADPEARAAVGGRFPSVAEAPPLTWILFHMLQEYVRHVGQLDIARELADGAIGE